MGSKLILLLGLLVGVFLTFMCVNENKTALSLKYNQIAENDTTLQTIAPAVKAEPVLVKEVEPNLPPAVAELAEPLFSYSLQDTVKLSAKLSSTDKTPALEEFILIYCPSDSCTQDLSFDENTKDAQWQKEALKIAAFLKDNHIKNAALSIKGNIFKLEGELENAQEMDALNELLTAFDPEVYKMENLTTITTKEAIKEMETPSVDTTQNEISQLLKTNPIYFEFNSARITPQSNEILDRVNALLQGSNVQLIVEGHTDAGGEASYNKQLSQKRADSVKSYLLNNGNQNTQIDAIGYGEEQPISNNPKDKINRRVEIHLKRGE
jgi:OOP family OmpA-OmpF porin